MYLHLRSVLLLFVAASLVGGCKKSKGGPDLDCPSSVGTIFDLDGDLLTNAREAVLGTNPAVADSDDDGFGDYVETSAGTDPLSASSVPTGSVATVRQITNETELIGGPGAQGRVGDWLLENDVVRAIVQSHERRQMQIGAYGGNLIDADIRRAPGVPGNDRLGAVIPILSFSVTSLPDRTVVINDGSDGGAAILRSCGTDGTFEYLDLGAATETFGLGIAYDSNVDLPLKVSNDYILAPGSDTIEIVTTWANEGAPMVAPLSDIIDSGATTEIFSTNRTGFGVGGFSGLLQDQPPTRFMAFGGPGSTWGYVNDANPSISVTLLGVTIVAQGFSSALQAIGSSPEDGPGPGMYEIPKGGSLSFHRGIKIMDGVRGVEPISEEHWERGAIPVSAHTGTVGDATGPLAGVRVAILTASATNTDRLPVSSTETDANGEYTFTVPDGDYYIAADVPGRDWPTFSGGTPATIVTLEEENSIPVARVTLGPGTALPDVTFATASRFDVTVREAMTNNPVPSRLTIVGTDPSPTDTIFRDFTKDHFSAAVAAQAITPDGNFSVPIEPGSYRVVASRGNEWSIAEANLVVGSGATIAQALTIGKAVQTPGWISADFHVHMMNSPDSPVPLEARVLNAATEGLEVLVSTDHDFVTDLQPLVVAMGFSTSLAAVPGDEISPTTYGHFIVWPLTRDPDDAAGGAYRWSGEPGPVNQKLPREIFQDIEAANPGMQVTQVCHPRDPGKLTAYYSAIALDTFTLQSKEDPARWRLPAPAGSTPEDTGLFYRDFDSQEIQNGATFNPDLRNAQMNDLFTFLSHGLQIAGMGNSDTHGLFTGDLGFPRNYVKIADDTVGTIFGRLDQLAGPVRGGQTFYTTGPFATVTVTGDTVGGPGDLVDPRADSTVTLDVRLEMPEWIEVDTLRMYKNTPNTAVAAGVENTIAPVPQGEWPLALVTSNGANGVARNVATHSEVVTVSSTGDSWIVVMAVAKDAGTRSLFPVVPFGNDDFSGPKPIVFVNAVFVDGNGNGVYDAPGLTTTLNAQRPQPAPPVRVFEARKGEIRDTPDVRAQFEKLMRGHAH